MGRDTTSGDSRLLFSSEHGSVMHCACRDTLVLQYHGYWLNFTRARYRTFHERLIESVRCPLGQKRLAQGDGFVFRTESGTTAFTLDRRGMEDLLWLLDSARYMLDARDAAAKGFRSADETCDAHGMRIERAGTETSREDWDGLPKQTG